MVTSVDPLTRVLYNPDIFFTSSYVTQEVAFSQGLAYVNENNQVIMKGDNTTWLNEGEYRDRHVIFLFLQRERGTDPFVSVRITSTALYTTGLFILDLNKAPWGCGRFYFLILSVSRTEKPVAVWPAFWTVGALWPQVRISLYLHERSHRSS
jgi:hypothetical protein